MGLIRFINDVNPWSNLPGEIQTADTVHNMTKYEIILLYNYFQTNFFFLNGTFVAVCPSISIITSL